MLSGGEWGFHHEARGSGTLSLFPRAHLSLGSCCGAKLLREADPVQVRAMLWQRQGSMNQQSKAAGRCTGPVKEILGAHRQHPLCHVSEAEFKAMLPKHNAMY